MRWMLPAVVVLAFLATVAGVAYAQPPGPGGGVSNPCTNQLFCPADAFGTAGNETVVVCAGTSASVAWFNVWYDSTGPLNSTNGGILGAQYYSLADMAGNGTTYSNEPLTNATGPCVMLVLNGTSAPFTNSTKMVNVTAWNNTNYTAASMPPQCGLSGCNGTMFTINYVAVHTNSAGGAGLPNVVIMTFNNASKSFEGPEGPAMSDSTGYWAEHCAGIVQAGNCVNNTPVPPNTCVVRGTPFPSAGTACQINATTTLYGFDFIGSNTTMANVTPGTPLLMSLDTPSAVGFIMASVFNPSPEQGPPTMLNITSVAAADYLTGQLMFNQTGIQGGESPPFFLSANRIYNINISLQGGANYSYVYMNPSPGITGGEVVTRNASVTSYTAFVGKVLNESGSAVPGAVVYAQFFKGGGGGYGISFFNSSVTDGNGRFSMTVPSTQMVTGCGGSCTFPYPVYQFYIVSNSTSGGVPIYFPTIDNNNNRGYFAQGNTVVLSPLTLKAGGQVNINATLNSAKLVMSELSHFLSLGTGLSRDAVTGKFTMISIFSNINPPASIVVPLLSPVNSVLVNAFGKNQTMAGPGEGGQLLGVCYNSSVTVSQGAITPMACNLTTPGWLNLTVNTCQDIFNCAGPTQEALGDFGFWFETNGILRNGSSVVMYLTPEGTFLQDKLGMGSSQTPNMTVPLVPGNYTLELASGFEWSQYLGVVNGTQFTIQAGNTTNLNIRRGRSWQINPMFNPSMVLSGNNMVEVGVQGSGPLNNTSISLDGTRVLLLNRSDAAPGETVRFVFDSSRQIFYNDSFDPSSLGLTSGKYWLMLNASNTTGSDLFTTTMLVPMMAFDFQVGVDLGGFTFGTGQTVYGKIYAFNQTGGVSNTSAVLFEVLDQNGNAVSTPISASSIVDGIGSVNITMPSTMGFYEIVTTVNASGAYGVSDNWVQTSNIAIKSYLDRQNYQPSDNVVLTLVLTNASSGAAISGANIQVVPDNSNTPAIGVTDSNGKAALTLSPSTYGNWTFGWHNLRITISREANGDIAKLETWAGFDVRGMDAFVHPDRPSYTTTDNVILEVFFPPGFNIQTIEARVDGNTSDITSGSQAGTQHWQVNLGQRPPGHHDVELTITSDTGTQKFFTGFDVNIFNIMISTDSFSYDLNSLVNLSVKASWPNGTAVASQAVNATMYKAQPPNDITVTQNSSTTDSNGLAWMLLNASKPGFNYIKVNMSGQLAFIGLQVSSVKVDLLSAPGGSIVDSYSGAPGSTINIYVNASSGGANVPDGSTVKASIWAFGNQVELPANTTTSGNATLSFDIPSFAPAQTYGFEVKVITPSGDVGFASPASLVVTGGAALRVDLTTDKSFLQPYRPGETAVFTARLTYPNGTSVAGHNITFEVGSENTRPQVAGTAVSGSNGVATLTTSVPTSDGPYFLHAYITNSSDVQAYTGFLVSSLRVAVTTDSQDYNLGANITVNITVFNRTSGAQVNATSGFIALFNRDKGSIEQFINTTGLGQPYQVVLPVPNESSAVGSYPIGVGMNVNQSQGFGFALVNVRNASKSLNLTLPANITAGTYFLVNISASTGSTAELRVFSPSAQQIVYENTSVPLTSGNASVNMTINNPGVYVFNAFVDGIGDVARIVAVAPPTTGTIPHVWTGTSTTANATTFTTSQDVYIMANIANTTASVLAVNATTNVTTTYSVPLTLATGSNYYGVLSSSSLVSGSAYFVRIDTAQAAGADTAMFRVS